MPLLSLSVLVCKKEDCSQQAPPNCPAHRRLSMKKTKCCDSYECTCNCQNSTHTCPTGFVTSSFTNDCGCTEILCQPDKVSFLIVALLHVLEDAYDQCVCPGVCGWWSGSPSGQRVGGRMREVSMHRAAGQRHFAPCCPVQPTCLRSELSSGEADLNVKMCGC